ncbi:MAG: citramalate synthase [Solirubrobacteraceae bacterium]|nr:citramalate synthase [Solirubrobacteraceae bacterium]
MTTPDFSFNPSTSGAAPSVVELYDASLRDGMQGLGLSLTAQEKLRVALELDKLGIAIIEAGFPASNPKEREFFSLLADVDLATSVVAAFGMTRRRDLAAADDPALQVLVDCFAPISTIVGKTWGLHLEKVVKVGRDDNLQIISDSVAFLRGEGKRVIYDAEHFFDAFRDDSAYALECLAAAVDAGAETVALCDTNGSSLPFQVAEATAAVVSTFGSRVRVAAHCHNDLECGVANSVAAVQVGASQVQGTMNGIGERTGNANLVSVIGALELGLDIRTLPEGRLARLTGTAHAVDELLNRTPDPSQPFVGRNAFAHKGGLHIAAVRTDATTFEHVDPSAVGNHRDLVISELAGRATVVEKAQVAGIPLQDGDAERVLERVKEREHGGFHYEAADASFELLLRRETGNYTSLCELESWRVIVERRADGVLATEATIKLHVDGQLVIRTAEGNGPVNALDAALREAIIQVHPHVADIELVGFKVRILDSDKGTGSRIRVLVDASDGVDTWGSIGVSPNLIEASWQALVDSLAFAVQGDRESAAIRDVAAELQTGAPAKA